MSISTDGKKSFSVEKKNLLNLVKILGKSNQSFKSN